jgi:hypothetical protein
MRIFLLAVGLGACAPMHSDAVVGTWHQSNYDLNSVANGTLVSSDLDMTFNSDGTTLWTVTAVFSHFRQWGGCTYVDSATGMSWSTSTNGPSGLLTVAGEPTFTYHRSGCDMAADNTAERPETDWPVVPRLDGVDYEVADATLTIDGIGLVRE